MAWIYLAELEGSPSHSSLGCEQSLTVKETDTLSLCCCRECLLTNSTEHQSGMTLHRSQAPCYQVSTSSSEDSPVRTSALQDLVKAWQESGAAFLEKSSVLQKKFIRLLSSSRMSQPFAQEDWKKLSKHLPKFGMTVAGQLSLPQALEPITSEKDGSFLPTPTASRCGHNKSPGKNSKIRPSLHTMALKNLWPTPCARDYKESPSAKRETYSLPREVGGQLSPTWVEWLMGFNLGWTVLSASVMPWFRSKQGRRSKGSLISKGKNETNNRRKTSKL